MKRPIVEDCARHPLKLSYVDTLECAGLSFGFNGLQSFAQWKSLHAETVVWQHCTHRNTTHSGSVGHRRSELWHSGKGQSSQWGDMMLAVAMCFHVNIKTGIGFRVQRLKFKMWSVSKRTIF